MLLKVFFSLFSLVLNFIFLNYVDKLEQVKCKCSNNWKREYIKIYSLLIIIVVTTGLFVDQKKVLNNNFFSGILTLIQLGGFVYIYCLYNFTKELKENCECSETWESKLMYNYSVIILTLYFLIIIMHIGVILFISSNRFESVCLDVLSDAPIKQSKSR